MRHHKQSPNISSNDITRNFNPWTTNDPYHIETKQLITIANQLIGFYMLENISR